MSRTVFLHWQLENNLKGDLNVIMGSYKKLVLPLFRSTRFIEADHEPSAAVCVDEFIGTASDTV